MLTEINDLNKIIEVLWKSWPMVSRKTRVFLAAVVLGAMNQACAVGGGADAGVSRPSPNAAASAPAALGTTALPANDPASRAAIRQSTQMPGAPFESVTVSPLADPAARMPSAPRDVGAAVAPSTQGNETDPRSAARISTIIAPAGNGKAPAPHGNQSASPQAASPHVAHAPPSTSAAAPSAPSAPNARSVQAFQTPPAAVISDSSDSDLFDLPAAAREVDPDQKVVYDTLWARMRAGFSIPDLESPLVDRHTDWYANRPDYVQRVIERGRRYMHFVVEELEKRGMPLEIALLPMIESAYNPTAYSKAHASGIWQFIPATGRNYGLKQNWWYDGRRDVTAATRAALDYLEKLHGMFGDWRLALAAYNWGEGAVSRAIDRNQRQGLPTDYESLRMPEETRNYIPKLQAVKNIIADPERYGLALDDVPNEPYFIRVAAPGQIDFKRAAQLAEVPLEEFRSLNPAHNRPVITADSGSLLIPADKADVFNANLNALEAPLVTWQLYRLERNERIESVAARFGTTAAQLRVVNGVSAGQKLKAGSSLLVPVSGARSAQARPAKINSADFQPPEVVVEPRTHRAHKGDTLRGIAARYGVTIQQLMTWNRMRTASVRAGQVLRVTGDTQAAPRRAEARQEKSATVHVEAKARGKTAAKTRNEASVAKLAHEKPSRSLSKGQRDAKRTAGAAKAVRVKTSEKDSQAKVTARRAKPSTPARKEQIAER